MKSARVVTGYVNLNQKPTNWERSIFTGMLDDHDYRRFGAQLIAAVPDAIVFETTVGECWLSQEGIVDDVKPIATEFPQKYTLDYMIAINQKIEWLRHGALACDDDVLVWIDYGVFKYAREGSVTPKMIQDFLQSAANEKGIAIPGRYKEHDILSPFWDQLPINLHFVGTVLVCARAHIEQLAREIKAAVREGIGRTGDVMTVEIPADIAPGCATLWGEGGFVPIFRSQNTHLAPRRVTNISGRTVVCEGDLVTTAYYRYAIDLEPNPSHRAFAATPENPAPGAQAITTPTRPAGSV